MEKRRELMQLKESDPEAFRKKVVELRNSAQKRLDGLKETEPETYQRIMSRRERRIEPRFEHLREENPEAFAKMQEHRRGLREKRAEWYRKNDPAKFEEIQQRRELRHAAWSQQGQGQRAAALPERPWKPRADRIAYDQNRSDKVDLKVRRQEWRENALSEGRPGSPDGLRKKRPQRPLRRENG
ncbi:MAG: hypothetical protein KBD07_05385, partial [Candidatus Omnitrophica bacterium]|nr:hypothetical protein [Candidatus Omnitrophota bacterium]